MSMQPFQLLLLTKYYVIPNNQRGYSWQPRHVEALLNDLELAGASSHYMGTLIVSKKDTEVVTDEAANTREYELDDGQQRMTTIFLILAAIKKRLEDESDPGLQLEIDRIYSYLFYNCSGCHCRLQNRNAELHAYYSSLVIPPYHPASTDSPPKRAMLTVWLWIQEYLEPKSVAQLIELRNNLVVPA